MFRLLGLLTYFEDLSLNNFFVVGLIVLKDYQALSAIITTGYKGSVLKFGYFPCSSFLASGVSAKH
jgi:hypothetical protein